MRNVRFVFTFTLLVAFVLFLFVGFAVASAAAADSTRRECERETPSDHSHAHAPAHAPRAVDASTHFVNLEDILDTSEQRRWSTARRALEDGFRDVCSDTFCEGDYSNIEPISLRCSVEKASGHLHGCTWVLGGSEESIHPTTGAIEAKARIFRCPIAVTAPAVELVDGLAAEGAVAPLRRILPSSQASIYDALTSCL